MQGAKNCLEPIMLTERFQEALSFALEKHRHQARKSTTIPYMSHLMSVSALVLEGGGYEDEAIGGLLHDAKEDAGGPAVVEEIRDRFGDAVAEIVEGCSEPWSERKRSWIERKTEYLARLPGESNSVHLVSSADKLHNARSILADSMIIGDAVWDRFNVTKEGTIWYYRSLVDRFAARATSLASLLDDVVSSLERCAGCDGRELNPSDWWEKTRTPTIGR